MEDYELCTYPLYRADAAYDSDKQSLRHYIALGFTRDWIHGGDCATEAGKNTHVVRTLLLTQTVCSFYFTNC